MAGRSEKKRMLREKNVGFYYSIVALFCLALWIVFHVVFPRRVVKLAGKTLIWRASLVVVPYGISITSIFSSLKLGISFSSSNDLFCLTTLVCILSIFVDWAYKLFIIIPLYCVYKVGKFIYQWALTPSPEPEINPKKAEKAEKVRYKYKTIRA